jgi:hypothetical protein
MSPSVTSKLRETFSTVADKTMNGVVGFFTSRNGIFAAIVAVVALLGAVAGLVRPVLKGRREAAEARPDLRLSKVSVEPPPPYSEAGHAAFEIVNAGAGKAVVSNLLLLVSAHGPTELPKMTEEAALVPEYTYKVILSPSVSEYDVWKKELGTSPPHSYDANEVEFFQIELRSTEPQWYEFQFVVKWYDVKHPTDVRELRISTQRIDFLPDITDVL